jgi:hypothetical protein
MEGVYQIALWAAGSCAESAAVAVCVGGCCVAAAGGAALCWFGDVGCACRGGGLLVF